MTFTDYLLDTVLVLLVLRQSARAASTCGPCCCRSASRSVVGSSYLHAIPTSGNDLA